MSTPENTSRAALIADLVRQGEFHPTAALIVDARLAAAERTIAAAEAHVATAATHPDPACAGWWQPRCRCGWVGPLEGDEGNALAHAVTHMEVAALTEEPTDGSESLSEYLRRVI